MGRTSIGYMQDTALFFVGMVWRSGTERAANGAAILPTVVVGRIDIAGAVEVEVVGIAGARVRSRRPVIAVVAGVVEQVAGILIDVAAPLVTKTREVTGVLRPKILAE